MKYLLLIAVLIGCSSFQQREPASEIKKDPFIVQKVHSPELGLELRTGLYMEDKDRPFRGCVLYLQGLADSIMNQKPLFERLSKSGFRVISFDYMGQGGSEGSMNNTKIISPLLPELEIGNQARWVWDFFSGNEFAFREKSCAGSKKNVVGWSTGGLAAYRLAGQKWADNVALIAPGVRPKVLVGAAEDDWTKLVLLQQVITIDSLTRNAFKNQVNPHIDPIHPDSPVRVPRFAANLVLGSKIAQKTSISSKVRGLVLQGTDDSYVDAQKNIDTIKFRASHFQIKVYPGALHELTNELPEVANDVHERIARFFEE